MIKKIGIAALQQGMFVHDLNCDWMTHPFLRSRFLLKSPQQLQTILDLGVPDVYIDTDRGLDAPDAPTQDDVTAELDRKLHEVATTPPPQRRVSHEEEMGRARRIHAEAHMIIRGVLESVRLGRRIELGQVEDLVDQISTSLMANPGALLSLCRIRNADEYTFLHSVSVGTLMTAFSAFQGLDADTVRKAGVGGLMHDLGKMKTPNEILNKPDRLTTDEFSVMKLHPGDGYNLLSDVRGIQEEQLLITIQHHERLDGSGYPYKLPADKIDPLAQMAAIADVYDALTAERCYHRATPPTDALRKLLEWSKHHFNPDFVHGFIRCVGIYPVGSAVILESGRVGIVLKQNEDDLLLPTVVAVYNTRQRCFIPPQPVDLSRPLGHGGGDRVLSSTDPEHWGINPQDFLG
jgi:HD-GYP domain-containing protein (c-di-GMP phosphodiesterase class II)